MHLLHNCASPPARPRTPPSTPPTSKWCLLRPVGVLQCPLQFLKRPWTCTARCGPLPAAPDTLGCEDHGPFRRRPPSRIGPQLCLPGAVIPLYVQNAHRALLAHLVRARRGAQQARAAEHALPGRGHALSRTARRTCTCCPRTSSACTTRSGNVCDLACEMEGSQPPWKSMVSLSPHGEAPQR